MQPEFSMQGLSMSLNSAKKLFQVDTIINICELLCYETRASWKDCRGTEGTAGTDSNLPDDQVFVYLQIQTECVCVTRLRSFVLGKYF